MEKTAEFAGLLRQSRGTVFFGGAGVSTESGIPDFRSVDGLYRQQWSEMPETILSRSYFDRHTEAFYRFYRAKMLFPDAQPNAAHRALAQLEKMGLLRAVITQNIDGLHQKAGSRQVIELHGSVHRNHCMRCGRAYPLEAVLRGVGVPHCTCGGIIKPDGVLYEEALPEGAMEEAEKAVNRAEVMIIGGTSLSVYPAAGFARMFRGKIVLINRTPTDLDGRCELVFRENIGEVMAKTLSLLENGGKTE